MPVQPWTRTAPAWLLFGASFACLTAGLVVALAVVRPLTLAVLAEAPWGRCCTWASRSSGWS